MGKAEFELMDLGIPKSIRGRKRRDIGKDNIIMATTVGPLPADIAKRNIQRKIEGFIANAIFPQQLSVPRDYATTKEGVSIYRVLKGRKVAGIVEDGVRVVVLECGKYARFVMSPLMPTEYDAIQWARSEMGLK